MPYIGGGIEIPGGTEEAGNIDAQMELLSNGVPVLLDADQIDFDDNDNVVHSIADSGGGLATIETEAELDRWIIENPNVGNLNIGSSSATITSTVVNVTETGKFIGFVVNCTSNFAGHVLGTVDVYIRFTVDGQASTIYMINNDNDASITYGPWRTGDLRVSGNGMQIDYNIEYSISFKVELVCEKTAGTPVPAGTWNMTILRASKA